MVEPYARDVIMKIERNEVDYDKTNNDPTNLVSLCLSCHVKTNFHREHWQEFFEKMMNQKILPTIRINNTPVHIDIEEGKENSVFDQR